MMTAAGNVRNVKCKNNFKTRFSEVMMWQLNITLQYVCESRCNLMSIWHYWFWRGSAFPVGGLEVRGQSQIRNMMQLVRAKATSSVKATLHPATWNKKNIFTFCHKKTFSLVSCQKIRCAARCVVLQTTGWVLITCGFKGWIIGALTCSIICCHVSVAPIWKWAAELQIPRQLSLHEDN